MGKMIFVSTSPPTVSVSGQSLASNKFIRKSELEDVKERKIKERQEV